MSNPITPHSPRAKTESWRLKHAATNGGCADWTTPQKKRLVDSVSNPILAVFGDAQALATILNDD